MTKMLFLLQNGNIPFGRITSTARRGRKWFDTVEPGNELTLHFTETDEQFGRAVVVGKELVTFADILERFDENHASVGVDDEVAPGLLQKGLIAAYGTLDATDEFTMVKFIRMTKNIDPRAMAYMALDSERDYQEALKDMAGKITEHEIAAFVSYMEDYLLEARRIGARDWSDDCDRRVLEKIRVVAALGVACMEVHGAPRRVMPNPETLSARVRPIP